MSFHRTGCAFVLALALTAVALPTTALAAPPPVGSNYLIDVSHAAGVAATNNEFARPAAVSADGRFVAFSYSGQDLLGPYDSGMPSSERVFLRDTIAGTTKQVSARGTSITTPPAISDDGMLVAYSSDDTETAHFAKQQVVVWNAITGTSTLVSTRWNDSSEGVDENVMSFDISGSGNALVYSTSASDAMGGDPFAVPRSRTYLVDSSGATSLVGYDPILSSHSPSISADGRFVAFLSSDQHTAVPTGGVDQAYVYDTARGTTELISVDASGTRAADGAVTHLDVSGDGRIVVFDSLAANLHSSATGGGAHVYARDRATSTTTLESRLPGGAPSLGDNGSISRNGVAVAYSSRSDSQIYVRSRTTGAVGHVSQTPAGGRSAAWSTSSSLSADGQTVVWVTPGTDFTTDRYPADRYHRGVHIIARNVGSGYSAGTL
jgi:Tol biopolymer transport system component